MPPPPPVVIIHRYRNSAAARVYSRVFVDTDDDDRGRGGAGVGTVATDGRPVRGETRISEFCIVFLFFFLSLPNRGR